MPEGGPDIESDGARTGSGSTLLALPVISLGVASLAAHPGTRLWPTVLVVVGTVLAAVLPRHRVLIAGVAMAAILAVGISTGYDFRHRRGSYAAFMASAAVTVTVAGVLRRRLDSQTRTIAALRRELEVERSQQPLEAALTGPSGPIERELARAARHGRPAAVVVAELDNCDLLLEHIGERGMMSALGDLAEILGSGTRGADLGEVDDGRIVCVLPETDLLGGRTVAERARLQFGSLAVPGAHQVPITARFGVAATPSDGADTPAVLAVALRALDEAAERSGNRTVMSDAAQDVPPGWTLGYVASGGG